MALYLTEIINAALTTICDDDDSDANQEPTLILWQKRLNKEADEVSLLLSTLNIYTNSPGIERMIGKIGKTFCIL